jgi:membrane-anchored protein YejM (alkaline phosphatase superfamily)
VLPERKDAVWIVDDCLLPLQPSRRWASHVTSTTLLERKLCIVRANEKDVTWHLPFVIITKPNKRWFWFILMDCIRKSSDSESTRLPLLIFWQLVIKVMRVQLVMSQSQIQLVRSIDQIIKKILKTMQNSNEMNIINLLVSYDSSNAHSID